MTHETCIWCGLITKKIDGPVHKYLGASPGCWALFGTLLAREYENAKYWTVHELTVDAYALQHPGEKSRQSINSLNVHLASLYSYFKLSRPTHNLSGVKRRFVERKNTFTWLDPPDDMRDITVADVLKSTTADEHCARVYEWARYIFNQWKAHHAMMAKMLAEKT